MNICIMRIESESRHSECKVKQKMESDKVLGSLQERLDSLEKAVLGPDQGTKTTQKFSCLERISSMDSRMRNSARNRENIRQAWIRLEEIDKWVGVHLAEKTSLSDEAKADIILAQEDAIAATAEALATVQQLQAFSNASSFADIPQLSTRLQPLIPVHIEQQEKAGQVSEGVSRLLASYNHIINMLSEHFVALEQFVSVLERQDKERTS